MNYMIKKKYEAAGGSLNQSRSEIHSYKSMRESLTRPTPGVPQLRPTAVESNVFVPEKGKVLQLGQKNIQNDNFNDSYLFEAKPVSINFVNQRPKIPVPESRTRAKELNLPL